LQDHDVLVNVHACSFSAECGQEVINTYLSFVPVSELVSSLIMNILVILLQIIFILIS